MKKYSPFLFIGITVAISALLIGGTFTTLGINEEALRATLRDTARLSLSLFLLIFIASPLQQFSRNKVSKWLMIHRRYLGISFGVSHLIHLGLIVWLMADYSNSNLLSITPLSSFVIGCIGYLFIIAMLVTSNNQSVKRLGHKRWKTLHTTGMYYLFFTFLVSFIGLLEKDAVFYGPFVVALILALTLRIYASSIQLNKVKTA